MSKQTQISILERMSESENEESAERAFLGLVKDLTKANKIPVGIQEIVVEKYFSRMTHMPLYTSTIKDTPLPMLGMIRNLKVEFQEDVVRQLENTSEDTFNSKYSKYDNYEDWRRAAEILCDNLEDNILKIEEEISHRSRSNKKMYF